VKKKAIILLSGGMDSAVTLYLAAKRGFKTYALIFDYGQRHKKELNFAKKIAKKHKTPFFIIKLRFPWKGSALLDGDMDLPRGGKRGSIPSTYVPARNTIMLSYAVSFAESIRAKAVFIGAHTEDYPGYPDCRPEFFRAFDVVKDLGTKTGKGIKICIPLIKKTKAEIIAIGLKLGVPYELTWSCYDGKDRPCGKCDSCYYRMNGFREAGIKDPFDRGLSCAEALSTGSGR